MLTFVKFLITKVPKLIDIIILNFYKKEELNQHVFFKKSLNKYSLEKKNDIHIELITKKEDFLTLIYFLQKHNANKYQVLVDIIAIDSSLTKNRFKLVYHFLSIKHNERLNVSFFCENLDSVFSLSKLYNSANWLEREVWDLFGIYFYNHPDLRRILTDYGFQGFPLRKDFPLTGFCELRYDDEIKSVFYDSLELTQEFRLFDFRSAWH
jgi:NADH/F420H2 dehydrogenase subunit C